MVDVDDGQPTTMDVDGDRDVTVVGTPESLANVDTVGSDATVSAVAVPDESHSVKAGSDVPVELDGVDFSGNSIEVVRFNTMDFTLFVLVFLKTVKS